MRKQILVLSATLLLSITSFLSCQKANEKLMEPDSTERPILSRPGNIPPELSQLYLDEDFIENFSLDRQISALIKNSDINNENLHIFEVSLSNVTSLQETKDLFQGYNINGEEIISLFVEKAQTLQHLHTKYPLLEDLNAVDVHNVFAANILVLFENSPEYQAIGNNTNGCLDAYAATVSDCDAVYAAECAAAVVAAGFAMSGTPAAAGLTLAVGIGVASLSHEACLNGALRSFNDCMK